MGVAYNVPIGVYRGPTGYRLQGGTAGAAGAGTAAYETWLGRPCTYALDYIYDNVSTTAKFTNGNLGSTNNNGTDSGLLVSAWSGAPIGSRTLMLGVPACIGNTAGAGATTWAQEATGASDTYWTALGNNLIALGLSHTVLRIGREMNENWYHWCLPVTGDTKTQHVAGWQHIVTLLRGLTGAHFKFMWNPGIGSGSTGYDFSTAYPGAAYVDYIGIDCYDFETPAIPHPPYVRTLAQQQSTFSTMKTQLDGLNGWLNFCQLYSGGVPLAFPEWGLELWLSGGTNYDGGGDNPYFINQMASSYISASAMHALWEDNNMGVFDPDTSAGRVVTVPNSRFAFLQDFAVPSVSGVHAPPSVPSFPAGYGPLPTDLNNWVSVPLGFNTAKTTLRVAQPSGGQALGASAYTTIQFPAAIEDPYSGWVVSATSQQPAWSYLAPYDGVYEVTVCVSVGAVVTLLEPVVQVSGNVIYEMAACNGTSANAPMITGSVRVALVGGVDYVQGLAWSSAAATTSTTGVSRECSMEIVYVGE